MKLTRLDYDPASALVFYEESLSALGSVCERTWHDRLEVLAEGMAAKLWNEDGLLHSQELSFAAPDAVSGRDPAGEVFPGCPLTFRLAELHRPSPLVLEKIVLRDPAHQRLPDRATLEKLWRSQYPATRQFGVGSEPKPSFHFSLVAVVRCDIQAIDQRWSLHRIAIALPDGETDDGLAEQLLVLEIESGLASEISWPSLGPLQYWLLLAKSIEAELGPEIEAIRARQTQYLQREIQRIDDYFSEYECELARRVSRRDRANKARTDQRLAAARAEHARRRSDQAARHEVRLVPYVDVLLLVSEPAWEITVNHEEQRVFRSISATFVPRARKWFHAAKSH